MTQEFPSTGVLQVGSRLGRARLANAISILAACGAGEMMAGMNTRAVERDGAPDPIDEFERVVAMEQRSIARHQRAEQGNNCTLTEARVACQEAYKRNVQLDRERKEAARLRKLAGVA